MISPLAPALGGIGGRDEAFPRDENAHHRGVREGQRREPALFSANSEGACPNCKGAGVIHTDLAMMVGVATIWGVITGVKNPCK